MFYRLFTTDYNIDVCKYVNSFYRDAVGISALIILFGTENNILSFLSINERITTKRVYIRGGNYG